MSHYGSSYGAPSGGRYDPYSGGGGGYGGGYGGGHGGHGGGGYGGGGGGGYGGGRGDLDSIHLDRPTFDNLPKFEKNFYLEHPAVTARTDEEVEAYRASRQIHVYGEGVPKPVTTFEEASFPGAYSGVGWGCRGRWGRAWGGGALHGA